MALTYCHECGKQISSEVKACPQCGAPANRLRQITAEARVAKGQPATFSAAEQATIDRRARWLTVGFFVLLMAGVGTCASVLDVPSLSSPTMTDAEKLGYMAVELVRGTLKDPKSATFSRVHVDTAAGVTCGTVNAKNGFGGYTGDDWFLVRMSGQIVLGESLHKLPARTKRAVAREYAACAKGVGIRM